MPLTYDIVVYSGTSYRREFRWLPDGINPVDFTGWDAVMRSVSSSAAQLELTPANGGITLSTAGRSSPHHPDADRALKAGQSSIYNLDLTEPDGFVRRFPARRVSVVVDVRPQTP